MEIVKERNPGKIGLMANQAGEGVRAGRVCSEPFKFGYKCMRPYRLVKSEYCYLPEFLPGFS